MEVKFILEELFWADDVDVDGFCVLSGSKIRERLGGCWLNLYLDFTVREPSDILFTVLGGYLRLWFNFKIIVQG